MGTAEKKQEKSNKKITESILVLHNDDVNTFDFVIETLTDICFHTSIQAEQCANIVHYNGKCEVKIGNYQSISEMNKEFLNRGLKSEVL